MSNLKMLTSKDGLKVKRLLGISDEQFERFKKMAMEDDEIIKRKNEHKLVINKKLPRTYVKKGIMKSIVEYHNTVYANKHVSLFKIKSMPSNEGYIHLSFKDLLKIEYPDETEVVRMIHEYSKPDLLNQLKQGNDRLENIYDNITVYYKIDRGMLVGLSIYDMEGVRITSVEVDEEDLDKMEDSKVDPALEEFVFKVITREDEDSFGFELEDFVVNEDIVGTIAIITEMILHTISTDLSKYQVTRDNLNTRIKKNNNEEIQLNREVKQQLKKLDIPIYYFDNI